MNKAEVLKNFNRHRQNKELMKKHLDEFEVFYNNLKLDPATVLIQISTSVQTCAKWGKLLAWINCYIENLEAEFEQYESLLWLEKKKELQELKTKDIKESDVRSMVRGDVTRTKLKLIISEWRKYSNTVKDAAFWPSTRQLDALREYRQILIGGQLSYGPMARLNKEEEENG